MTLTRRILLFFNELGVLVFGCVCALVLGVAVGMVWEQVGEYFYYFGLIATFVGFLWYRRTHRAWKIEYDAAVYTKAKTNRKLHPQRARWKRVAWRLLIWVPSAIAAFVLFYFPQATHLLHPSAGHFKHYRVRIPGKFVVFTHEDEILAFGTTGEEGWFGTTRSWNFRPMSAEMNFGSFDPDKDPFDFKLEYGSPHRPLPGPTIQEFAVGDVTLSCWSVPYGYRYEEPRAHWYVHCQTPLGERARNFYAEFSGERGDLSVFYDILRGVRLLQFAK